MSFVFSPDGNFRFLPFNSIESYFIKLLILNIFFARMVEKNRLSYIRICFMNVDVGEILPFRDLSTFPMKFLF